MLNQFLYNQPLKFNYEYTIKNNQIVCLKYDSIPGYYKVKKRAEIQMQKLSVWAYKNHPALLERDLTTDILKKLIELYTEQKK